MTQKPSTVELAERASRRRSGMVIALSGMFLTQQALFLGFASADRMVDQVRTFAWLFLAAVLLAVALTGGFWLKPKAVRALMEDETTRANRAASLRFGYTASMTVAMALYATLAQTGLDARGALHVVVSVGLVAALVRFGTLERRSLG